jgi:glycosyltransferase involved in cell wall biosynthesis
MTSIYEGAATPLLEAGVCGIPIIASPAGLAPQFLMNGGGVLTETFDEAEYIKLACNTLTFWQDNPAALRAESEKIYKNTRDYFSWDAVKSQWAAAIDEHISL